MAKKIPENDRSAKGILNPFPGLRPFTPGESDLFFGREGQSGEVLNKLKANRFVTVIGASGSGKSSLIYCGVIPHLIKSEAENQDQWQLVNMRPGNDPLGNLSAMIAERLIRDKDSEINRSICDTILRQDEKGLVNAVSKLSETRDRKLLILVDQFEELFRYRSAAKSDVTERDAKYFVNLLVNAVKDASSGISVIITMRSDYIGDCAHFQGLTELINNSNYLIPHMAEDNYRRAITGPVEYAGASIDDDLLDLLISEIGDRTDQLPVLQHALMRTWEHWQAMGVPDRPISISNYDAVGQMAEAMSRHANEAFEELSKREQEICESLFKTITEKGADNKGTRHPTRVSVIAAIARCPEPELIRVINAFRSSGRSFITPGEGVEINGETVIDISHESIMRLWDRLSEWVDKEAASVQMYLRLSEAAAMFQEGKTTLWRPPDLQLALNWRDENMPTLTWAERFNPAFERAMVYLRTSEKEFIAEEENKIRAQKRQLRRSRITAIILGTAAIISMFFMLFAFVKQVEAEKNRQEAEQQRERATIQQQRAEENAEEARLNEEEARRQEERALANADSARISALEALRQKEFADRNAQEANVQRSKAEMNAELAEEQRLRALALADTAQLNAEEALRLRMVSVGKSMAVKSVQLSGEGQLQTLLAYQAYLFNKRNGGTANDADIYMGLYNVAKTHRALNYKTFDGHSGMVNSIVFRPGTQDFFTSGSDGKVLRWNVMDPMGQPGSVFEGNEIIEVLSTSSDGQLLACGNDRAVIRIIPVSGEGLMYELTGHTDKIKALAFTPDNKELVSSGVDGKIIMWDMENRKPELLLTASEAVNALDVSVSGKYLIAASDSGLIHLWDLENKTAINALDTEKGSIRVVRFMDDKSYAVGYQNGLIEFWNVGEKSSNESVRAHSVRVTDIQFNDGLRQMASSGFDGLVKIWNYDDLTEPPISLDDNDGFVFSLSFSTDGRLLLSGSSGNVNNRNLIARPTHVDYMVNDICNLLTRNFTVEEWWRYVGRDIDYEETCSKNELSIKVQEKKGD